MGGDSTLVVVLLTSTAILLPIWALPVEDQPPPSQILRQSSIVEDQPPPSQISRQSGIVEDQPPPFDMLRPFVTIGNQPPPSQKFKQFGTIEKQQPPPQMLQESSMFVKTAKGYLYQGDIMLTEEQAMEMVQRNMFTSGKYYWPRNKQNVLNINYVFGDKKVSRDIIAKSIAEWEKKTCVRFTKLDSPPADKSAHFKFIAGGGCWSHFGTTQNHADGGHDVSVDTGCDLSAGIHEIGHALGLEHEQSRSDRDKYVKILWDNMKPDGKSQYTKANTFNYGVPYDYYSTMHYAPMFYSKGKVTLLTLQPKFQTVIGGYTERLSFMDSKLFNIAYKCVDDWNKACPDWVGKCKNQGYVKYYRDSKQCGCDCPEGTDGEYCEKFEMAYNDAILQKYFPNTEELYFEGSVTSPNYPKNFGARTFVTKYIEAPNCQRVSLKIEDLQIYKHTNGVCAHEFLEVRTDVKKLESGEILCGEKPWKGRVFKSKGNVLVLNLYSYWGYRKGFNATFKFEDEPGAC